MTTADDYEDENIDPLGAPLTALDIKSFTVERLPVEERDEGRTTFMLPTLVWTPLRSLKESMHGSEMNTVAICVLTHGLARVRRIKAVLHTCVWARTALQFGHFVGDWTSYGIAGKKPHRLALRHVTKKMHGELGELRDGLGLPASTIGALCLMCGLVDCRSIAPVFANGMQKELREFQRQLAERAAIVMETARRANERPHKANTISWGDTWRNE